ncbi:F-box/kelch-repeat protein At1g80440-like [Impatiens glandulifera]|uniref:F-box/kelch-repeat protein At1g80440-like n=1 Tax=Impatiens glandulifera TaxID=253017 RepID=UPI001FB0A7F8|nr:F-box/kelch-repeat protein At1g80440-like [Impatiens glandulifera]
MDDDEELIPSLPNDLALECLIRLPFYCFTAASKVSKSWKTKINLPEFRQNRKLSGSARFLMVLAQAWSPSFDKSYVKSWTPPIYRLTMYDPQSNNWSDLPPLPWFPSGLPMICRIVVAGSDLVVLGGCDPVTWRVCNSVFIYNFISGDWRIGSDMPGHQRLFFACASDSENMIYVAGGHDEDKRALKTAMAYDVENDKWVQIDDMARERDECRGVFRHGRFHVIGGYCTERQGEFEMDMECFNVLTGKWEDVEDNFLDESVCPERCVGDCDVDGRMYIFGKKNLLIDDNNNNETGGRGWKILAGFPDDVSSVSYATTWQGKRLMIGYDEQSRAHNVYTMDVGENKWTRMDSPLFYTGPAQSICSFYL